jgi:hypothetical protein
MTQFSKIKEPRARGVRGPFIEYECTSCGCTVSAKVSRNTDRLVDRIAELNADPRKRICASCWHPSELRLETTP